MSEAALPASGPEREIFLRALRRMSDECEAPELLAECPFSVDVPDQPGVRGCGEECLELLKRHGGPASAPAIPLGSSGIAARPFRKRHRPPTSKAGERAFDAAEWYYIDAVKPRSQWKCVSLFYEFGDRLLSAPVPGPIGERRVADLTECAAELQRRDFDVGPIVRYALDGDLIAAIAGSLVVPPLAAIQQDASELDPPIPRAPQGWNDLLSAVIELDDLNVPSTPASLSDSEKQASTRLFYAFAGKFSKYLAYWIHTGPLPDILAWTPPSQDDFIDEQAMTPQPANERQRVHRWINDRFTRTYLDHWADSSLLLEWRFMEGLEAPPAPADTMAERTIDGQALATAIANRTAGQSHRDDTLRSLKATAIRFLREGRRSSAVAVFEAARDLDPEDSEIQNNYGFCLLPDNPEEALRALEHANEMGYSHKTSNVGNRMLALHMLGRDAAALALAERVVDDWDSQDRRLIYWLWDFNRMESPQLLENACPSCYVLGLAVRITEEADEPLRSRWRNVRAALIHQDVD